MNPLGGGVPYRLTCMDTTAPTPEGYSVLWWPATFTLPTGEVWRLVKAYATPSGLYVFRAVPKTTAEHPDWFAPIDRDHHIDRPLSGYAARNGIVLRTTAGKVAITPEGACGCSNPLKQWRPTWAQVNLPW